MWTAEVPWPASSAELLFEKRLGRGFFGEVWKCELTGAAAARGTMTLAVKKVPIALVQQHRLTAQMEREIAILRSLNHHRIVRMFFDFRDSSHFYLGMEFAAGGMMFERLSKMPGGKFDVATSAKYFFECCDALAYLHGLPEKIIHRDIKPENILIDGEDHVKLADFGWSNIIENSALRATFCGTPDYLAPEMVRGDGHDESIDMWEMGVLLYEMVVGKSPFGSSSQGKTCKLILKCDLHFPSDLDSDARDLIVKLCRLNPKERLTASEAKQHSFVVRLHQSAPSEVEAPSEVDELNEARPSVVDRGLRKEKELLEGEMMHILQAKSRTEQQLLAVNEEEETIHEEWVKESKRHQAAKAELSRLQAVEDKQVQELEELRRSTEVLSAEIVMKRGVGTSS
eukprot:TRINITY_DN45447_c0_g1_i1.p1 TRINITY_DN45447_c0_g1~~TRINITY_DN45447_c0_g1_i1.p1  ORF type:complete len:399 (-),score=88.32 TRINITY_DN45447_c0_g1_i1:34-1230(-)